MSDEFEDLSSRIPDFGSALAQRVIAKNSQVDSSPPAGTVDPYQVMLKRKQAEVGEIDPEAVQHWPDESVKLLEDYCKKIGIYGFNCGRMHPAAALAMLKKQFGDYSEVPLEERVPEGYEKRGTHSGYGPNYPYTQTSQKKQILHD